LAAKNVPRKFVWKQRRTWCFDRATWIASAAVLSVLVERQVNHDASFQSAQGVVPQILTRDNSIVRETAYKDLCATLCAPRAGLAHILPHYVYHRVKERKPTMPIVRLIYVTVNPDQATEAEHVWKTQCAPLMIQQHGCLSEKMLKCVDAPGEYISYSEWESQETIDAYRSSDAHNKIKEHTKQLRGERPVVKRYEVSS
jgi:heme-degrading monooxygenase HmoA